MRVLGGLALLFAGCAGLGGGPQVLVRAASAPEGTWVRFRRTGPGAGRKPPKVEADGGVVARVVRSDDDRTVSVLWRRPRGTLFCFFDGGGSGLYDAAEPAEERMVNYVFLDAPGAKVTARLPFANPMRDAIALLFRLDRRHLPARLVIEGREPIAIQSGETPVSLELALTPRGTLAARDHILLLESASGTPLFCLVGVDPDGTPTATTGYVETGSGSGR